MPAANIWQMLVKSPQALSVVLLIIKELFQSRFTMPMQLNSRIWVFQGIKKKGLDWHIANQLRREEMIGTLEADATQSRESQQQLGKTARLIGILLLAVLIQCGIDLLTQRFHSLWWVQCLCVWQETNDTQCYHAESRCVYVNKLTVVTITDQFYVCHMTQ